MNSNSALAQQGQVATQGEVSHEVETMMKNLEALRLAVGGLQDRVAPILADRKESSGAETSQPEPVRVPLAQRLHDFNGMMAELENQVKSIANRIEL